MAEHFMCDVLRWLADGKDVQMYENTGERWVTSSPDQVMRSIIHRNRPRESYRLKPPTFVLNGVEIGLPITPAQATAHKGLLFIPSLAGESDYISVSDKKCDMYRKAMQQQMLFADPEDAAKASRALQSILTATVPIVG